MGQMLYFLPGLAQDPTPERLVEIGFADRLGIDPAAPSRTFDAVRCQSGPGGAAGHFVALASADAKLLYKPDEQIWHEFAALSVEDAERNRLLGEQFPFVAASLRRAVPCFVGWFKDRRPGPRDLRKPNGLRGVPVSLNDGHDWEIPVAVLQPQIRTWEGTHWGTKRDPRHDVLWELAERIKAQSWERINAANLAFVEAWQHHRELMTKHGATHSKPAASGIAAKEIDKALAAAEAATTQVAHEIERLDPMIAVEILSVNYRVGPEEVSALELMMADPVMAQSGDFAIIDVLVDGAGVRAARMGEKKTADG